MTPEDTLPERSPWAAPQPDEAAQQAAEPQSLEDTIPLPAYRPERLV